MAELLFDKWDLSEVESRDMGIRRYVNLSPRIVMHTGGKHASQQFNKSDLPIVERLINRVMREEANNGKKQRAYKIVRSAFEIIHNKTKKNPVQVLVDAIGNAGPREEVVRLKYGGIAVPKAVDTASQRRVDIALRLITKGAKRAAFKSKRSIENCLADEIMAAASYDVRCHSINQKQSIERVAKSAR
ncbi:MAG TPA: 30S ribosomal protein S7 [Methanosarcinales archaeon]|nr:30S ribosomal protein S7 [Methanosarcinales archaeon]